MQWNLFLLGHNQSLNDSDTNKDKESTANVILEEWIPLFLKLNLIIQRTECHEQWGLVKCNAPPFSTAPLTAKIQSHS